MYSTFYTHYMRWIPKLGSYKPPVLFAESHLPPVSALTAAQSIADEAATRHGNEYRGVGVLIGLLGILIVFAALAPGAFDVSDVLVLRCFGVLKVSMMCLMLFLVYRVGHKSSLKNQWMTARKESERDRYKTLRDLIHTLHKSKTEEMSSQVRAELARLLLGPAGQIHYNHSKALQYEAIEKTAERISWIGFFIALLCAFWILLAEFEVLHHHSVLILGTAFLPALVGGVHGINGFLTVVTLADDHAAMAKDLGEANKKISLLAPNEIDKMLELSGKVLDLLEGRDAQWMEKTQSGNRLSVA